MANVIITHDEADSLFTHFSIYLLQEVRDSDDYDNIDYFTNLVHIYEKCRDEVCNDKPKEFTIPPYEPRFKCDDESYCAYTEGSSIQEYTPRFE